VYWPDFFGTSACRDLLFHVQEHQFTLPEIDDFSAKTTSGFSGSTCLAVRCRNFDSVSPIKRQ
jgi:hypothetical protein